MTTGREISYSRNALKALRAIDARASRLIRSKIEQYATDPASLSNNVKALKGTDSYRLRVGDYRVIFNESMVVVTILKIGHRREIYD